ncbi:SRPBCC domain-containing protein [Flavobacterium sp. MAH-1]|uniref:SRPBCC domain-containing protein n=1 Tax=Flavobacterium agri TaxID=2743471 RepID=A0A7Y8Y008_9FLAO|nr:SRPBCC domain-containing protein [Flavobacterium agri]NUY79836.1 SRPBCC domain-containing protein [Flavobacterium agri]NYA69861.1 SRPBCC domain-containing protein [Flavobacterium agri]
MERKTKIHAEDNRHDLTITREFDLPLELLFKAYTEPRIVEQWMDNNVLLLENKRHGGYEFQKSDANGNVVFEANGCIHEFIPNRKIVRTFEMTNAPFDVQLEFLEFEKRTEATSRLTMHVVYKSVALRDAMLKLPFAYGINMAHDRLEEIVGKLK